MKYGHQANSMSHGKGTHGFNKLRSFQDSSQHVPGNRRQQRMMTHPNPTNNYTTSTRHQLPANDESSWRSSVPHSEPVQQTQHMNQSSSASTTPRLPSFFELFNIKPTVEKKSASGTRRMEHERRIESFNSAESLPYYSPGSVARSHRPIPMQFNPSAHSNSWNFQNAYSQTSGDARPPANFHQYSRPMQHIDTPSSYLNAGYTDNQLQQNTSASYPSHQQREYSSSPSFPTSSKGYISSQTASSSKSQVLMVSFPTGKSRPKSVGSTCHQCKQKNTTKKLTCRHCPRTTKATYCKNCLHNRYGEDLSTVENDSEWKCPLCRGICNCASCRKRASLTPHSVSTEAAKKAGYKDVHSMLQAKQKEEESDGKTCEQQPVHQDVSGEYFRGRES